MTMILLCRCPVHPRTRGEHISLSIEERDVVGSSPHTRGTCLQTVARDGEFRFIPAHAGNIVHSRFRAARAAVHPRTRGEHMSLPQFIIIRTGSSPHTRGTCKKLIAEALFFRFIPAHAGNIAMTLLPLFNITVHPRTRGEHETVARKLVEDLGSSPHTRGTCVHDRMHNAVYRFIPAHAGNISPGRSGRTRKTVHPRTRGEHKNGTRNTKYLVGSSPHTRGTYDAT